jgi:hypothetical protein
VRIEPVSAPNSVLTGKNTGKSVKSELWSEIGSQIISRIGPSLRDSLFQEAGNSLCNNSEGLFRSRLFPKSDQKRTRTRISVKSPNDPKAICQSRSPAPAAASVPFNFIQARRLGSGNKSRCDPIHRRRLWHLFLPRLIGCAAFDRCRSDGKLCLILITRGISD